MTPPQDSPRASLTDADVDRIAHLARLTLTPAQREDARTRLGAVLGYMETLRTLDLSDVEPWSAPPLSQDALRDDEPSAALPTDTLMHLAPHASPPFLRVPKVLPTQGGGGA